MRRLFSYASALFLGLSLIGCAGTVKKTATNTPYKYGGQKVKAVNLSLTPEATKSLADNIKFDPSRLQNMLHSQLSARSLIDEKSGHVLDVKISNVRVRSTFSAVMFGFMAGDDHVNGTVNLLDAGNSPLHSFDVSASYAFGGIAGGDDIRMNWLYEKFSELTVVELVGPQAVP